MATNPRILPTRPAAPVKQPAAQPAARPAAQPAAPVKQPAAQPIAQPVINLQNDFTNVERIKLNTQQKYDNYLNKVIITGNKIEKKLLMFGVCN